MPSQAALRNIKTKVENKLRSSIHVAADSSDGKTRYHSKACCVCDIALQHSNLCSISVSQLHKRKWMTPTLPIHETHYSLDTSGVQVTPSERQALLKMALSPRSMPYNADGQCLLHICLDCYHATKRPKLSIIDVPIGSPSPLLQSLNEVELSLVSKGRISGHTFHLFGGAHKSLKTWHQMNSNDAGHTLAALYGLEKYDMENDIQCILSGPFTPSQKQKALKSISINRDLVKRAFLELAQTNIHYANIRIPQEHEIPTPVVIDAAEEVASENTNIEEMQETVVFFPEIDDSAQNTADHPTKDDFLKEVLSRQGSRKITLLSKSKAELVRTWRCEEFIKCFPLQFPFGLGAKPDGVTTERYIKYLLSLSNPHFQAADFILVLANLYFKDAVVKQSGIKCKYNYNNQTATEKFSNLNLAEMEALLEDPDMANVIRTSELSYFLRSVFAISRCLPFSDEAVYHIA